MTTRARPIIGLLALALLALGAAALRLTIDRPLQGAIAFSMPDPDIAWIRWTALAVGAIAGSSLAVSGVVLQALLRNPLASPFILGISAGAGLGVVIATYLGHVGVLAAAPQASHLLPAIIGAVTVLGVVYALAQRRGWLDPISLVLIGAIVSTICGSLIMFFHHLVPTGAILDITRWMMGRIPEGTPGLTLMITGALAVFGVMAATVLGRAMDAATLGDDEARSIGLSLGPLRVGMFLLAGALAAGAVALCGPIGFVGLVAPHAARIVLGPRHTPLVLASALAGIVLVVGSDVARQAIDVGAGRMPIGVFTALIGGPAFIWLLRSGKGQA